MLLIFAHHQDAEAQWLCKTLKHGYNLPVYLLMPEALGIDYSISLHLNNKGLHHATVFIHAPEIRLECTEIWYAINRLSYIDPIVWQGVNSVDKAYAASEINAFFPALIYSLKCPVSNVIHNGALYGEGNFSAKWAAHFQQHNVPVHPLATDVTGKVFEIVNSTPAKNIYRFIYFGGEIISPLTQGSVTNYADLERTVLSKGGSETLEFIFLKRTGATPELLQISKTPSLSYYGEQYIGALFKQIKQIQNDHTFRHTQRNALTAAC